MRVQVRKQIRRRGTQDGRWPKASITVSTAHSNVVQDQNNGERPDVGSRRIYAEVCKKISAAMRLMSRNMG